MNRGKREAELSDSSGSRAGTVPGRNDRRPYVIPEWAVWMILGSCVVLVLCWTSSIVFSWDRIHLTYHLGIPPWNFAIESKVIARPFLQAEGYRQYRIRLSSRTYSRVARHSRRIEKSGESGFYSGILNGPKWELGYVEYELTDDRGVYYLLDESSSPTLFLYLSIRSY